MSVMREIATDIVRAARTHRVIGIAGELSFFALLSFPPALLALAGAAGSLSGALGDDVVERLREQIIDGAQRILNDATVEEVIAPAVDAAFEGGNGGIISVGAIVALWSASRMVKVLIEDINITYGVGQGRTGWRRRIFAFILTVGGLLSLLTLIPIATVGPALSGFLDDRFGSAAAVVWQAVYWPTMIALGVAFLATLYHLAPNARTPWRHDVPGAIAAGITWVIAALGLRIYLAYALPGGVFGPLAAPTAVMLWMFVSSIAVLVGAELNAALERRRRACAAPSFVPEGPQRP